MICPKCGKVMHEVQSFSACGNYKYYKCTNKNCYFMTLQKPLHLDREENKKEQEK